MDCLDAATHPGADGLHGFFLSTATMWSSSFSRRFDGSDVLEVFNTVLAEGLYFLIGAPLSRSSFTLVRLLMYLGALTSALLRFWIALRRQERGA
jgi:hypothetical protein